MQALNLPSYTPKVSARDGKYMIYDPLRQKEVALTPEEWVRQHFVNYLITCKSFPRERMANEVPITLNGLSKRCDTIIYNRYLEPLMIIEYKAPSVTISKDVFDQITRYNMKLRVPFLIVSNGILHYCCKIDYENGKVTYLEDIPGFLQLEAL